MNVLGVSSRRLVIRLLVSAVAAVAQPSAAFAQSPPRLVTVNGFAYDSLTQQPLVNAIITVTAASIGAGRSAFSDAKGRWRIDSVGEGTVTLAMQHAAFDSIGMSGVTSRAIASANSVRVVLAVPSFATLWRAVCGDVQAPRDSALVYGSVRDASTLKPEASIAVEASWIDLVGGGKSLMAIGQRRWRRATVTDASGEYALCGVPVNTSITVRAARDSATGIDVELEPTVSRVRRRDVLVARAMVEDSVASAARRDSTRADSASATSVARSVPRALGATGVVRGTITNAAGLPVANAAVAIDAIAEVRSGDDGRFVVSGVPIGTRAISIVVIGMQPYRSTVDVRERDTVRVLIPMSSVQTLSEVRVKATVLSTRMREIEERKRLGLGYTRDSTAMKGYPSIPQVLASMPNVIVRMKSRMSFSVRMGNCTKIDVRIDGHPATLEDLGLLEVQDVAYIEEYHRNVPTELISNRGCPLLVWTKAGLGR